MKEPYCNNSKLFSPQQPSVSNSEQNLHYIEVHPTIELSNHIYCYWQFKTKTPLNEPYFYRIIADGCIDIIISCLHPYESRIMGFSNSYNVFPLGRLFNFVGIRFLPGAFPLIFNFNASEITDKMEILKSVLPRLSEDLGNIVANKYSLQAITGLFDTYFIKLLANLPFREDKRICSAINTILMLKGNLSVENDIDVGLSLRQLRRLFEFYIGDSPKSFSRIVQFQSLIKTIISQEELQLNKCFYDFGYYDQSHFIKNFIAFYGLSPSCVLI